MPAQFLLVTKLLAPEPRCVRGCRRAGLTYEELLHTGPCRTFTVFIVLLLLLLLLLFCLFLLFYHFLLFALSMRN